MMYFNQNTIQAAIDDVKRNADIELIINPTDILVIADHSQALNEFEVRLAARSVIWDDESVDGSVLLDTLINIQGTRSELRPRHTNDEWQARYHIVAQ